MSGTYLVGDRGFVLYVAGDMTMSQAREIESVRYTNRSVLAEVEDHIRLTSAPDIDSLAALIAAPFWWFARLWRFG